MYAQSVSAIVSKNIGNTLSNHKTWGGILYNVKEFGAKGDGVTDDTDSVQSALTAAKNATSTVGALVYFPPGSYVLSSLTLDFNNCIIAGSGNATQLCFSGSSGDFITIKNNRFIQIRDLEIETKNDPSSGSIIKIDGASFVKIQNVTIGFYSRIYHGIRISNTIGGVQAVYIDGCIITKFKGSGIGLDASGHSSNVINDVFIKDNWVQWLPNTVSETSPSTSICLELKGGGGALQSINLTDNEMSNAYWGLYTSGSGIRFLHFENSYFDANNWVQDVMMASFDSCWFSGNSTPNSAPDSFTLLDVAAVKILNCHIDPFAVINNSAACVNIKGSSTHIQISDCLIGGAGFYGIVLNGGDNIILSNNYIGNHPAFTNPCNIVTAVQIISTFSGKATIQGNDLSDATYKIYNGSSTAKIIAKDNQGYNPVGYTTAPTLPASGASFTNPYCYAVRVFVSGGSVTGILINGQSIGITSGCILLEPGEAITIVYSTTPTWNWFGL